MKSASMTSERCIEGAFFNRSLYKCQRCETKYEIIKGYEFTENCGWSDEQQQIESPYRPCRAGTFNDGSQVICQNCRSCPPPQFTASVCKNTSDTICCKQREQFLNGKCIPQPSQTTRITTASTTVHSSVANSSPSPSPQNFPDPSPSPQNFPGPSPSPHNSIPSPQSFMPNPSPSSYEGSHSHFIGIYVCFGILSTLALACLFLFIRRRTKPFNEELKKCCNGASHESLSKKGIATYEQSVSYNIINDGNNDHVTGLSHMLAPEVHDAPLKTVLDNLDVLEELVLVLDPDISGAKSTRHLAAQCSFSFAWINYAYSMKDHKSPLVAVLEGVVTKNPDWTVGHLAELLNAISRNDAVEILAKLPAGV
ncbi:IGF-like family receptor 1 isoform X2 [Sinocyclocheilus rhinocerous]|uniref:IGF-like family receptor 1 n=1 Tax=Sinocyclocheilus rhinocerous TaxID=307959 RepID=A0A673LW90_9TELE|nr:PREDICTED: IGF-like family receptor 1 isoform X2 [Sinocyclocheilus rhinocerous]